MDITTRPKKLSFSGWKKDWEKRHCRSCQVGIPNPLVCYVCVESKHLGFACARCARWVAYLETVCGGSYNTGSCLCAKCRAIIQQVEVCHEYSRVGYSEGHPIHQYSVAEIAREVKLFFRGDNLWAKVFCRACQKKVAVVKLACACYLEQKKHQHKYSQEKCLDCYRGYLVRPVEESQWKKWYREYSQWQDWQQEFAANKNIRAAYEFSGVGNGYWATCSFCEHLIKGQEKNKQPLEKNMVRFWSRDKKDGRLICDFCLVRREVLQELRIEKKVVAYWLGQRFSRCEICEKRLEGAGHMGKVKNRNNAGFWELKKIPEKILCLECIQKNYREQLTSERRKVLSKYLKRGYV